VNLSGNLRSPDLLDAARRTAFIDVDPGFTQIWHADPGVGFMVPRHDHYFTIGENIGMAGCPIPTGGLPWRPTRQPLLLDHWPAMASSACHRFTTIASWRAPFGSLLHDGVTYGLKLHEFRRMLDLPRRVPARFEMALEIHDGDARDREALLDAGWCLVAPGTAVPTPAAFRDYVQRSDAEFSVAQGVYAHAATGWFSDRSTRYLASGKPVLVQETGLREVPTGEGIVTFRTLDEAVAGAERIIRDYPAHARIPNGHAIGGQSPVWSVSSRTERGTFWRWFSTPRKPPGRWPHQRRRAICCSSRSIRSMVTGWESR